jgi:hypothetical protein
MRFFLLAVLVACGGSAKPSPTPISNQPTSQPMSAQQTPASETMPVCADSNDVKCAISVMEHFQRRMCNCKDKACADGTNEAMTKWGTEMAKNYSGKDEKPNPDMAKKSADIMTKYVECMTKLMMGGQAPANPCGDPCGGDPCGN